MSTMDILTTSLPRTSTVNKRTRCVFVVFSTLSINLCRQYSNNNLITNTRTHRLNSTRSFRCLSLRSTTRLHYRNRIIVMNTMVTRTTRAAITDTHTTAASASMDTHMRYLVIKVARLHSLFVFSTLTEREKHTATVIHERRPPNGKRLSSS